MRGLDLHLPVLPVLVPLFAAVLSAFFRRGAAAWLVALVASAASAACSFALLARAMREGAPISYTMGGWAVPFGIEYRIDVLNAFVLCLVTSMATLTVIYARRSVGSEIDQHAQAWFYTMLLLCLTGLAGMTATGDAFNVFVFLEISSLSTYVLIAMGRDRRALVAAYQYLILGTIGATFYVIGIGLVYLVTGSLNLADIASRLATAPPEFKDATLVALGFVTVGLCLKLALFPLHLWLPNAYAYAPSAAAVFLAATATKVAIYLLLRLLFSVFGAGIGLADLPLPELLIFFSLAAMILASASACLEGNAKRLLAYSSLAQIGYITLGIALANKSGLTGSITHLLNHAVMKGTAFMALGAVAYRIGSVRIADLAGIGRTMPLTMAAFVVGGLGLVGIPGTAGFVSKWYLAIGALEKGYWPVVAFIVVSSVLALVYVGRVIEAAYFREPIGAAVKAHDPPPMLLAPMWTLAAATILLGLDTRLSADIAAQAASALLGGLK